MSLNFVQRLVTLSVSLSVTDSDTDRLFGHLSAAHTHSGSVTASVTVTSVGMISQKALLTCLTNIIGVIEKKSGRVNISICSQEIMSRNLLLP